MLLMRAVLTMGAFSSMGGVGWGDVAGGVFLAGKGMNRFFEADKSGDDDGCECGCECEFAGA